MQKLRLANLEDDRPVKVTIEIPAAVHRDLVAYAHVLGRDMGQAAPDAAKLIAPMLARFMATDRVFLRRRKSEPHPARVSTDPA